MIRRGRSSASSTDTPPNQNQNQEDRRMQPENHLLTPTR